MSNTAASSLYGVKISLSQAVNKFYDKYTLLVNTNHYRLAQEQAIKDINRGFGEVLHNRVVSQSAQHFIRSLCESFDNHLNDSKFFSCPTGLCSYLKTTEILIDISNFCCIIYHFISLAQNVLF